MRLVLTALPPGAARRLSRAVLSARLAACVNVASISSTYWWRGRLERATERLLIFKTTRERAAALVEFVQRHHPYEVPEIAELPVARANDSYLRYLADTLGPTARARPHRRAPRRRG